MKKDEKDQARKLRGEGMSITEIVEILHVAKSSVSVWVRDVVLTTTQQAGISRKGRSIKSVESRRISRLRNERTRRRVHFDAAVTEISDVTTRDLFHIGCALYWGEGTKTKRGTLNFTNSDPRSIQVMRQFFKRVCGVSDEKFRGHVILHPHLDKVRAERYWSQISEVPLEQFYKTSMQQSKSSKGKKDSLSFGTFSLSVNDTVLYLRVMGWLEGMYSMLVTGENYVPCKYHQFL